ncbi:MAG: hypothetical protein MUE52_12560 [Tabrizicola sp.]|jgi:hypothetical protein|nr:hypothetical protein [Tabrizicola sp.]
MFKPAVIAVLLVSTVPALAESWAVTCPASTPGPWPDSQVCSEGKMLAFTPPTPTTEMVLKIRAPRSHCSEVTYLIHLFPGSSDPIATLERLKPSERKTVKLGNAWADGENFITVTGVGHTGGCNVGMIHSFGAETEIVPR